MNKLQVLVATMGQKDLSLARKMNIPCAAILANQDGREEIREEGPVKMITTSTRGVGKNRNIALAAATGDYLLFADDDVVYYDGLEEAVVRAFEENPQADMLVFGMDIVKNGVVTEKRHLTPKRLHVWNAMRFGTYTLAVRRTSVQRCGITFHESFGGGCPFSAGEDTLFIKRCFDAGLRVYAQDYVLGTCCKDTSSWFVGYNDKYFYDKGVLVRHLFPRTAYLMAPYFAIRFKRQTSVGVGKRLKLVYKGARNGKKLIPYGSSQ